MLHDEIKHMLIYVMNRYHLVDDRLKASFREFVKFAGEYADEMDIRLDQIKAHDMTLMARDAVDTSPQTLGLLRKIVNALGANIVKAAVLFIGAGGSYAFKKLGDSVKKVLRLKNQEHIFQVFLKEEEENIRKLYTKQKPLSKEAVEIIASILFEDMGFKGTRLEQECHHSLTWPMRIRLL